MGAIIPIPIPIPLTHNGVTTDLINGNLNDMFDEFFGNILYGPQYNNPLSRLRFRFLRISKQLNLF